MKFLSGMQKMGAVIRYMVKVSVGLRVKLYIDIFLFETSI